MDNLDVEKNILTKMMDKDEVLEITKDPRQLLLKFEIEEYVGSEHHGGYTSRDYSITEITTFHQDAVQKYSF